eukprot:CAMPEP_0179926374 /NCGR_PEP_ID=MMETSP0983-20121128/7751_1 /TAXON_ID=483367 /ORGANISM="non described non described, Strain CCMP 2436" /LENGTH=132 /DNA_ID=CAMNT_0021830009 /DNA_START=131 /DNA_END=526 /DNA_ORIENTATION=+
MSHVIANRLTDVGRGGMATPSRVEKKMTVSPSGLGLDGLRLVLGLLRDTRHAVDDGHDIAPRLGNGEDDDDGGGEEAPTIATDAQSEKIAFGKTPQGMVAMVWGLLAATVIIILPVAESWGDIMAVVNGMAG